jgi:hypothetical protein
MVFKWQSFKRPAIPVLSISNNMHGNNMHICQYQYFGHLLAFKGPTQEATVHIQITLAPLYSMICCVPSRAFEIPGWKCLRAKLGCLLLSSWPCRLTQPRLLAILVLPLFHDVLKHCAISAPWSVLHCLTAGSPLQGSVEFLAAPGVQRR